jgi:L-threonylcarbamoyladenylate synthase
VNVPVRAVDDPSRPDPELVGLAGARLRSGGLVAFPTETVYGLGAALDRVDALERVFAVKGRPRTDPLILHVADAAAAVEVVATFPAAAAALAEAFWPGPLTLVLPRAPFVDDLVTAGGDAVAVRVPAHPVALALLRDAGRPVAAPSANRFGRISPTEAAHVVSELDDRLDPARDLVLDAGPTPLGIESTVVALGGDRSRLLRAGGVSQEELESVIGPVEAVARRVEPGDRAAVAPGGLLRHYAPTTPMALVDGDAGLVAELHRLLTARGVAVRALHLPDDPDRAAAELYRRLREADEAHLAEGVGLLLAGIVAPDGIGRAVNDRLFRAAHGRVASDAEGPTVDRLVAAARA